MNLSGIARSGLAASMMRLNASASNVANADSVGSTAGGGAGGQAAYGPIDVVQSAPAGGGVAATYARRQPATVTRYDPGSIAADGAGLVAAPNVDLIDERLGQVEAGDAFAANVAVLRDAGAMTKNIIDLLA
jgi:flagellar basal-body rod protein FlgC